MNLIENNDYNYSVFIESNKRFAGPNTLLWFWRFTRKAKDQGDYYYTAFCE